MAAQPWQTVTTHQTHFPESRAHGVLELQSQTAVHTMQLPVYTSTWINLVINAEQQKSRTKTNAWAVLQTVPRRQWELW